MSIIINMTARGVAVTALVCLFSLGATVPPEARMLGMRWSRQPELEVVARFEVEVPADLIVEELTTIHFSFSGLHAGLLEGLETSLKEVAPIKKLNVFFNRQGVLL